MIAQHARFLSRECPRGISRSVFAARLRGISRDSVSSFMLWCLSLERQLTRKRIYGFSSRTVMDVRAAQFGFSPTRIAPVRCMGDGRAALFKVRVRGAMPAGHVCLPDRLDADGGES